jgi:hypothetical protein
MNPLLESVGQIAAIIICLFVLVFIILAVAFNLAMAFGMSWLAEKIQVIKLLRPTVESVNKATESTLEGLPPDQIDNRTIRTIASIPTNLRHIEEKVDQGADKVADAVIEFRARTVQAKTILKAFFLPGSTHKKLERATVKSDVPLYSSGYRVPEQESSTATPSLPSPQKEKGNRVSPEEQVQHASVR